MTTPPPNSEASVEPEPNARPQRTETEGLREWLLKSGFPLEMRVTKKWRDADWGAGQGTYFDDPQTNTPREIDVLVASSKVVQDVHASVWFPTACKKSESAW